MIGRERREWEGKGLIDWREGRGWRGGRGRREEEEGSEGQREKKREGKDKGRRGGSEIRQF